MNTRTVTITNTENEVADYLSYLTANGWLPLATREREFGRVVEVTFAF